MCLQQGGWGYDMWRWRSGERIGEVDQEVYNQGSSHESGSQDGSHGTHGIGHARRKMDCWTWILLLEYCPLPVWEVRSAQTEAAAYTLLDVDYALLSTARGRGRDVRSTWTEVAADGLSGVDYAFLSTSPRRRKESRNWTWTDTATCDWARSCAGSNGAQGHPSLLLLPPSPPVIPGHPLLPHSTHIPSPGHEPVLMPWRT